MRFKKPYIYTKPSFSGGLFLFARSPVKNLCKRCQSAVKALAKSDASSAETLYIEPFLPIKKNVKNFSQQY